jgi:hypothetical protein
MKDFRERAVMALLGAINVKAKCLENSMPSPNIYLKLCTKDGGIRLCEIYYNFALLPALVLEFCLFR